MWHNKVRKSPQPLERYEVLDPRRDRHPLIKRLEKEMAKVEKSTAEEAKVDVNLMKALGHPLRQRILQVLTHEEEASPSEIAAALGEPLTNVSYHVKILRRCDAIELVRTEVVRSAVERFYRAKVRATVDQGNWRNIPANIRESLLDQTMQQIWKNVVAASEGEGLRDPRTTAAWAALRLDDEAFTELSKIVGETMERALALQAGAKERLEALAPDERDSHTRLVELDAMLYPIEKEPTP